MHSFVNIENVTLLWRCQCFDTQYYMFVMFSWQPVSCSLVLLHYLLRCYALRWLTCYGGFVSGRAVFVLKRDLQPNSDDCFMSDGCYTLVLCLMVKEFCKSVQHFVKLPPRVCWHVFKSPVTRRPFVMLRRVLEHWRLPVTESDWVKHWGLPVTESQCLLLGFSLSRGSMLK